MSCDTGGDDYTSGPYTVSFPAGVTSVPFDVPIIDDEVQEINERFTLVISPTSLPSDVTRGNIYRANVTIGDNDGKDIRLVCIPILFLFVDRYYSAF